MVELFEKCLVLGVSFIVALSLYPSIFNSSLKVYESFSDNQIKFLAKEIDEAVKAAYMFKKQYSLSYMIPKDLCLCFEDGLLKILFKDKVFIVGVYSFNIFVEDFRASEGFSRISFIEDDGAIFIVVEDAV
ncbi:MAG: hypothetical protein H5T50_04505 [Nitrososphaeria archaeon]|nr:hypothetical protein [Nitrososphaeria archaeon]